MTRLLAVSLLAIPVAAVRAEEPTPSPAVPAPTTWNAPSGSLSQSLPSLVSGGVPTMPPPPVMVSQPTWGTPTPVSATPGPVYPGVQPMPIPQYQVQYGPVSRARRPFLARLREWWCGGPGPAFRLGLVFAPPHVPLRAWTPYTTYVTGDGGGGPGKCEPNCGRIYPSGVPLGQYPMGGGTVGGCAPGASLTPVGYETGGTVVTAETPAAPGPRPILIPLSTPTYSEPGAARPGLLRRLLDGVFSRGGSGGATGCTSCGGTTPLFSGLLPGSNAAPSYSPAPVAANAVSSQPVIVGIGPTTTTAPVANGGTPVATSDLYLTPRYKIRLTALTDTPQTPTPVIATKPFTEQK